MRPSWDEYFLGIAEAVAARADCTRSKVGAVIVKNNRIVSTGYNGSPVGEPGCLTDGACPRGKHYEVPLHGYKIVTQCACSHSWPCPEASEPCSSYDNCPAVHAEANALLYADRDKCEGATLYVTREPCAWCAKLIRGAGITRVHFRELREQH